MDHQKMDWGYVKWFIPPQGSGLQGKVTIGVSSVDPGVEQKPHIHYGNAQFLYVLKGKGFCCVNGNKKTLKPGEYYYVPANSEHQTINTGTAPILELVVSVPVQWQTGEWTETNPVASPLEEAIRLLDLESLVEQGFPILITDADDHILLFGPDFPACFLRCYNADTKDTRCQGWTDKARIGEQPCSCGTILYHIPILENGTEIGWIHGAFQGESGGDCGKSSKATLSRSTATGIEEFLLQIAEGLSEYVKYQKMRSRLSANEEMIRTQDSDIERMSDSLLQEKKRSTDLRINHHFLFNILNHFASLALTGERNDLYEGIIDLSTMLRASSQPVEKLVTLQEELDFVAIYLRLQKRRYQDGMRVIVEIDAAHRKQSVPFNFMQPIIENAFAYGFMEYDGDKEIYICSHTEDDRFVLTIKNNGVPVDMVTINRLNQELHKKTGHGLNLIYEKLQLAYGSDFTMKIGVKEGFTRVQIAIPRSAV